jgi:hypothetical protein
MRNSCSAKTIFCSATAFLAKHGRPPGSPEDTYPLLGPGLMLLSREAVLGRAGEAEL